MERLKIVVAGAHPDDPESGCGGTIARYVDIGHKVVNMYLTRGEAGIQDKVAREAACIRTVEAERACSILGAKPVFVGQIDSDTEVNARWYNKFTELLEAERPNVVFAHWPIDTHPDHRAMSLLVYEAWLRTDKDFGLYYFEVMSGMQTQHFWPTHYVDITTTESKKREACFAHLSQHPERIYSYHQQMQRFRGMEAVFHLAEAFVRHHQNRLDYGLFGTR